MKENDVTRYRKVKELFVDALDQSEEDRLDWLRRKVGDDKSVYADVVGLLEAHFAAEDEDSLSTPLQYSSSNDIPAVQAGQQLGSWLLTEFVGRGGMGSVFKARRADGAFEKEAAVKVVRSDIDVDKVVQRFEQERHTLAKLDHPNIARLLDGGSSAVGPYLVMEYVDGTTVTNYCSEGSVALAETLKLFLQVCDAVGYAHRNLVVHRDLKPSNILITKNGTAKLLDFGIATLISQDEQSSITRTSSAMTPAYAAPEQIQNRPITTATDTYSLGVLLFELLSGERPYDLSGKTPSEIEVTICTETPPAPSRLHIPHAGIETIPTDLDVIVLKALSKEPERRYATAEAFADDIRRFMSGDPVTARSPTVAYRLGKFVRKNAVAVAAAVFVVLSLVVGLSSALWQARVASQERDKAEERFDLAREVTSTLLFDIHDAVSNLSGSTPTREMIIARSLSYLEELDKTAADQTQLRIDIARAYRRIGDVLGNPSNNNLGRISDAVESYEKGLAALDGIDDSDSLASDISLTRALLLEKLADVNAHTGNLETAISHLDRSIANFQIVLDDDPVIDNMLFVAIGKIKLGDYTGNRHFPNLDDPLSAHDHYTESLGLIRRAEGIDSENARVQRYLGLIYERFGTVQEQLGRVSESRDSYRQSLSFRERLWRTDPGDMTLYRDAGIAHEKVGLNYQDDGDLESALKELTVAHSYYTDIVDRDPTNANARITLAVSEMQLGALRYNANAPHFNDIDGSVRHYRRARAILREVHEIDTSNVRTQSLIDETDAVLARLTP